jgi:hypothetical protein
MEVGKLGSHAYKLEFKKLPGLKLRKKEDSKDSQGGIATLGAFEW